MKCLVIYSALVVCSTAVFVIWVHDKHDEVAGGHCVLWTWQVQGNCKIIKTFKYYKLLQNGTYYP